MERLRHKITLAVSLLLISFALLVSLPSDRSPGTLRQSNVSQDSIQTTRIRRPRDIKFESRHFEIANSLPARKQFQAKSLTTDHHVVPVRRTGSGQASLASTIQEDFLDDLPELDLQDSDSNSPVFQSPTVESIRDASGGTVHRQSEKGFQKSKNHGLLHSGPTVQPGYSSSIRGNITSPAQSPSLNPKSTGKVAERSNQDLPIRIAPALINSYLEKLRYANSLARRGAISSAFEELKGSLKLLAEAIDQLQQTQVHSSAVQSGFLALKEVSDLATWSNDLSIFVAGHETDILKNRDLDETSFHEARLAYLGYAEKQLRKGCENMPLAAETFRSLGKVFLMQEEFSKHSAMSQAKAMLMFRLATTVNPDDADSARELGILYAKYNHFDEAKQLLVKSLRVRNDSTTWDNLAKIHRFLGENRLAMQATNESSFASSRQQRVGAVLWTNPANFNRVQSMVDPPVMTARTNQTRNEPNSSPRNASAQRSFNQRSNRR